jgi:AcrR family transcriptional regulator
VARSGAEQPDAEHHRLGPLPSGRHSIDPEVIAHNQRERLLAAVAQEVAEHGYAQTTIRQIAEAASVSRRTLYEHFSGKEGLFLAAYCALDDYLGKLMAEAASEEDEWPDRVAAAFAALIGFLVSRPAFARLYLIEAAAVGEPLIPAREATTERLLGLLEPGREFAGVRPPAAGIEEALVGGMLALLARRVVGGEAGPLDEVTPAVVEFLLSPYIGMDGAREVAARHAARP